MAAGKREPDHTKVELRRRRVGTFKESQMMTRDLREQAQRLLVDIVLSNCAATMSWFDPSQRSIQGRMHSQRSK